LTLNEVLTASCAKGSNVTIDLVTLFFAILQIFFSELKYTYIEDQEAYTLLALMCDIGGAMGLILGGTMLTVCELTDFLVVLAATWIKVRASTGILVR